MPTGLASLPGDLLFEVSKFLDLKADVLSLASSARRLFFGLLPALYGDVCFDTFGQCEATLFMLNQHPDVARHVQKLVIRFASTSSKSDARSVRVSNLVRTLAPKLDALNTFVWDAEEIPQCDDMWFALQMSCPLLHTVGTPYGAKLPASRSCLFQFKNLRSFRLTLKSGFYDNYSDSIQVSPSDSRLWEMLIRRCPNLEELHIAGAPFLPISVVHPLCHARWPNLRSLSLGDIVLDWQPRGGAVKPPFIAFLEAHPHLELLRTSRASLTPAFLSSLDHGSLPNLTRFGGSLEHLQGLARIHSQITSVAIDEPLVIRDMAPILAAGVLQGLRFLSELRVSFVFHSAYEGSSLVRSIVAACPRLTKLELICVRRPSFTISSFANIIRALPHLHHLRLTLVRSYHEEALSACAALIARSNPQLQTFCITFISPDLPFPIPLATEICMNTREPGHPYEESGSYVVGTDEHGLPQSIACMERSSRSFSLSLPTLGIPMPLSSIVSGGTPRVRNRNKKKHKYKYTIDLYPKAKKGLGLILEKSAAGEEVRVLLLMLSLGGAALWLFFG
ncbi:hypothetical protein SCLCIDRAFT_13355 [Scleroderma citrinum Foug A]|uniref:F-box domain-containing protein n=1 Tax=Scleroderma citrinum Foug A TaxID=1036808 RepID=A0A0C3EM56_9AGAM|nr:hypothetical protein SCLCIDRAFT_13355 [Scleroderma citrinum Foug A]